LGGSADLFAQRLRLGEARGVETPLALASHATCSTWGDPLALASPFGRRPQWLPLGKTALPTLLRR
jgi:hypothetical protein